MVTCAVLKLQGIEKKVCLVYVLQSLPRCLDCPATMHGIKSWPDVSSLQHKEIASGKSFKVKLLSFSYLRSPDECGVVLSRVTTFDNTVFACS